MAPEVILSSGGLATALALGFLPPLFWLWFWLKEDEHPEPRRYLFRTFIYGMIAALFAIPAEYGARALGGSLALTLLLWAAIEESFKYLAARRAALRRPVFDEPADAVIYLITAALGFAAMENILFLTKSVTAAGLFSGVLTGNLRFLGAVLLHVASSSALGASIGYAFFHREKMHRNLLGGLGLSTGLHFLFNYFILKSDGNYLALVFLPLWLVIIGVFLLFEKVKSLR